MITDIEEIKKQAARDIVTTKGLPCFCVNEDGVQIPALEYGGHYWNLHGDPLTSDWERLHPRKNLLKSVLFYICALSLVAFVVFHSR